MAASGMTGGAFYAHFRSKVEFLAAIAEYELARSQNAFADKTDAEFMQAIAHYLSVHHVEHPETGCVLSSLTSEISRSGPSTRRIFEDTILKIKDMATRHVADESTAWPMVCQLVGAVMIARAMESDTARQSLLSDVLRHCKKMAT
jgi:AcrR family transcriptional regulator